MKNNPFIAVIKINDFRYLWLGQIISQVSLNMLSFVLAVRVYRETNSNTAVSLMLLCFSIPSILFGILAGSIVDHYERKKILLFCNLSRVLILVLFFVFAKNLFILYFLSIIISIITQLFIPAEAPSIPVLVPKKLILTANSLFTVSFYLSSVTGYILSGPMVRLFGSDYVYLLMSVLMVMASFFIWRMSSPNIVKIKDKGINLKEYLTTIKDGFSYIKNNNRIEQSLILMTFSQSLITVLAVLSPGFSDKVLSIDLNDASYLVLGPAAIGLIIGAVWVGQFGMKYLKGSIILAGVLLIGSILAMIPLLVGNLGFTVILLLLLGVFNSFVSVPANTILQGESDNNMRGRIYGVLTSLTGGISLLPVVFSGILADVVGVGKTLLTLGLIVLGIGLYQLSLRKKMI